ncbi:hypothetical protein [Domibacillus robiginosus]|uniref:Dph6-related ATP pyrophosphatase n=1 Tax=Domibacillus robiginosus TaxID=1071054 RepID=UPI00067AE064|nr:hypothetical protein [Domibacillus robiginosus]
MVKRYALSWSGGKDCMMVLHTLKKQQVDIACLITTVPIETGRTFGHDEKTELIEAQSKMLGLPVHFIRCRYDHYTEDFIHDLNTLKEFFQLDGIAYGDIYTDAHFEWGENTAASAGLSALFPLRAEPEQAFRMLEEFLDTQYKAVIIRTRKGVISQEFLGRTLDASFAADIAQTDCCPMGENGEFHTFVYDGPLFQNPIPIRIGDIVESDLSCRLELFI